MYWKLQRIASDDSGELFLCADLVGPTSYCIDAFEPNPVRDLDGYHFRNEAGSRADMSRHAVRKASMQMAQSSSFFT